MNEKFKAKIVMVKGEKGNDGNSGDYAELINKPQINGVELDGNKSSSDLNLISGHELEVVNARIDNLIIQSETSASGFTIEEQTADVEQQSMSGISFISHSFTLPENSVILETAYREDALHPSLGVPWMHENIKTWVSGTEVRLQVDNYSAASTAIFKIVYAYPESGDHSELADVRVGYDGTVYQSAGDAVRAQASKEAIVFTLAVGDNNLSVTCNVSFSEFEAAISKNVAVWLRDEVPGLGAGIVTTLCDTLYYNSGDPNTGNYYVLEFCTWSFYGNMSGMSTGYGNERHIVRLDIRDFSDITVKYYTQKIPVQNPNPV